MKLKLFFVTLIIAGLTVCSANEYPLIKVADGIYYHQGVHEEANEHNHGAIANVGLIIGQQCIAIVDSGGSYKEGQLLRSAIKQLSDKPVCYVINTHVHPDHLFGNAAFKADNPKFVGHDKLAPALLSRKEFFERTFSERLGNDFTGTEFITPDVTVTADETIRINLGNRELLITAFPTSHTDNDITVYDVQTKTLWTGDLLFRERIPVIDGSLNGWINSIAKLQQLDVEVLIPGHGTATSSDQDASWQKQLHYLSLLREQIRDIIADLGTIEEATEQVAVSEKDHWELFDQYHRRNITTSFVELEWE